MNPAPCASETGVSEQPSLCAVTAAMAPIAASPMTRARVMTMMTMTTKPHLSQASRALTWLLSLLCLVAFTWPAQADAKGSSQWEVIKKEQGITVSRKYIPNYNLPIIKGVGRINANIYEILALINDIGSNCQWMSDCHTSKLLKKNNDLDLFMYNRTKTPWPLDDRDAVIHAKIIPDMEKRAVTITFEGVKSNLMGPVKGVVRMPILKGFYYLRYIGPEETEVVYQAQADVGGNIPDTIAEWKSKDIPFNTILALRKQVKKSKGTHPEFMKQWNPAQGGKGFPVD